MREHEALLLSEPMQQALAELRALITGHVPDASFDVRQGVDDAAQTFLVTTVDIDDPDTVMDIVLDRLLELKFDDGLPVNVVPVHTPARIAETRRRIAAGQPHREAGMVQPGRSR